MFAELTILGRLGADPEMRFTQSGKAVTSLRVATDQGYGENKSTLWVKVTCWGGPDGRGGLAEAAANYLHKGSAVFVKGEPSVSAYIPNTGGDPRASLELTARELKFLDPKPANGNGEQQQARPAQQQQAAAAEPQLSPDGNYQWDGKAWIPVQKATPPPPPPPPGPDNAPRDVDPDDIPF